MKSRILVLDDDFLVRKLLTNGGEEIQTGERMPKRFQNFSMPYRKNPLTGRRCKLCILAR